MRVHDTPRIIFFADFYLLLACMILLLPIRWVIAFYTAAAVHELFHGLILTVLGGRITDLTLRAGGIYMGAICDGVWKQILCAIAGPIGGLSCLLLAELFPELAICALIQSLYNLLPLWPLDGGRVLRLLLQKLCPANSMMIEGCVRQFLAILGIFIAVWCGIRFCGGVFYWSCVGAVLLKSVKTPCKARKKRIQ